MPECYWCQQAVSLADWPGHHCGRMQAATHIAGQRDELLRARQVLGAERIRLEAQRDALLADMRRIVATLEAVEIPTGRALRQIGATARAAIARRQPPAGQPPAG